MAFTDILNLSISASWLVLAVVIVRLVLKKAPKALHCALWALVAIRLLCPVSIESELSLLPTREVIPHDYLAMEPSHSEFDQSASLELITNPVYDAPLSIEIEPSVDRIQHWDMLGTVLWLAGMGAMAIYAASYLSLRLRVRMAAWVSGRVWECDELDSPFILGLLRPRIYLPSGLDEATKRNVLAHENAHLKRLDHLWKPLGFLLLSIHWFNPVMWLAYTLLCRDIELACDEKVIKKLDKPAVRAYSESLVRCAVSHRSLALCPLAFGEVGVKSRIKAMTRYKKPGLVLSAIAIAASVLLAACFLTDPVEPSSTPVESAPDVTEQQYKSEDLIKMHYIYRPEGLPAFTAPEFQLFTGDHFIMMESAFSSYHGQGKYTLEDGVLELRTDDGHYVCVFTQDDFDFIYDRERSNDYLYYYDENELNGVDSLPDGTRFVFTDWQLLASQRLDAAISADLLKHYSKPDADGRINTVSYDILNFSFVSGTPLAGTTEHTSRLTVYLAAQCSSYLVEGSTLTEENSEILNVCMTYLTNETGIELTGIRDSKSNKLSQVYDSSVMKIWESRKETTFELLKAQCLERAQQQLLATDGDTVISALLQTICSSPAQSSNPGEYIKAHQEEYDQLLELGDKTVRYCFVQFAQRNCWNLNGHILANLCREIIGQTEEVYEDGTYMTGQDWFNTFAKNAGALLRDSADLAEFKANNPYHALALEILGYI